MSTGDAFAEKAKKGLHEAFLRSNEDHRRTSACREAARLAIARLRDNSQDPALQIDFEESGWQRREYALYLLIMNLMGLIKAEPPADGRNGEI